MRGSRGAERTARGCAAVESFDTAPLNLPIADMERECGTGGPLARPVSAKLGGREENTREHWTVGRKNPYVKSLLPWYGGKA
jgi:hypothetical protein